MAQLPRGPLAAYLGVRNENEAANLAQLQMQFQAQRIAEDRKLRQELASQSDLRQRELAGQADATRRDALSMNDQRARDLAGLKLKMDENKLEMQNQFNTARIGAIGDENLRKREADAWKRQYEQSLLTLKQQMANLKGTPQEQPLKPTDLMRLIDKDGNHPPLGSTMEQAIKNGFKVGTTQEINMLLAGRGAEATVSQLEKYVESVWGKEGEDKIQEGVRKRLTTGASLAIDRLKQSNPDLIAYEAFGQGTLAPLIRAIGEKGALAEGDIQRGINLIPKTGNKLGELPDTSVVARQKMKQLRQWFTETLGKNVATPSAGGEWTDDKEKRYQELLRKRGGS